MNSTTANGQPRQQRRPYPATILEDDYLPTASTGSAIYVVVLPHHVSIAHFLVIDIASLTFQTLQKRTIAVGSSPPTGYIVQDTLWPDFIQRLEDLQLVIEYSFRPQGRTNQAELSAELVEHLQAHDIQVPEHEDDTQNIRFTLCQYKKARAPANRSGEYEHRLVRDDKATTEDWALRRLRTRNPDLKHRGIPMIFVGTLAPQPCAVCFH
jgi:hypothetical protein